MTNQKLIERYPWLKVTNRWTGEYIEDYDGTELDAMPSGWRAAFGEQMCAEIHQELMTWPREQQEKFRITDIKEKWAHLCFYTNLVSPELVAIIDKYTNLSKKTCIQCGKPAHWITRGWYMPMCHECAVKMVEGHYGPIISQKDWDAEFIDINEYYKKED